MQTMQFPFEFECAGMRVRTNREVAVNGDDPSHGTDTSVTVAFADDRENAPAGRAPGWHPIRLSTGLTAELRDDGAMILLDRVARDTDRYGNFNHVKSVVPFASALQGNVVLHASAVGLHGEVCAFLGESGAGKSTLARALASHGLPLLADDLLPLRVVDGKVVVPVSPGTGREAGFLPIAQTYILRPRSPHLKSPETSQLSAAEALIALMREGFAELALPRIWRRQFEVYSILVRQAAPAWLTLPDDPGKAATVIDVLHGAAGAPTG